MSLTEATIPTQSSCDVDSIYGRIDMVVATLGTPLSSMASTNPTDSVNVAGSADPDVGARGTLSPSKQSSHFPRAAEPVSNVGVSFSRMRLGRPGNAVFGLIVLVLVNDLSWPLSLKKKQSLNKSSTTLAE